ncbi:type III-A CRISPR-associated protein Cas10/Csm1 [Desulfoferrobacter suflitae]|uniref:type III-A CRISPR-associated protein Cas10/Csm1 n=1 Tax=Desulfoferrobacter suflitae TaxID=2865782 RepID=UPI002164DE49|nr:type III-A CRISPR-associated protein Cas10/Csm1 [Desulfoferrobacter suflitae]MCK8603003.1 type III-A CRISPR-associated protein Cas10/Csm1 [Desulfoferrobacter suflitae]
MDDNTLKVAIAAFLHDIGKLADERVLNISKEYLQNNADLYQPFHQGRHTHRHAVFTAAFIEHMEKWLPAQLNAARWGLEDSFINLAAGHHKPESPLQWIIAVADRVSSGWDRASYEKEYNRAVSPRDYKRTRLTPLFEHLVLSDVPAEHTTSYDYIYPLAPVSPSTIFPIRQGNGQKIHRQSAENDYAKLFEGFVQHLEKLSHRTENLALWFEHFENLMMIFTSSVPAARAGNIIPDVSLFDHAKVTSALASALYLYHRATDSLTAAAVRDDSAKKMLLVGGDFYGIQKFIFSDAGEAARNRSKILRGRSFAVSLMTELAADMLCRNIGIPSVATLLNAAGKFTIIAPNTESAKHAIQTAATQLDDWLMKISFGESALGISWIEVSTGDLVQDRFVASWERLTEAMEHKKCRKIDLDRFGGAVQGYLDHFRNDLRHPLCPFCGKRPSSQEVEGSTLIGEDASACAICRDHILLGTNLVKRSRLAVATRDADIKGPDKLLEPIFDTYQVAFVSGKLNELARTGKLLKYWDVYIDEQGEVARDVTAKFINGYVPVTRKDDWADERLLAGGKSERKKEELLEQMQEGAIKTFGHIANKALNLAEHGKPCGIEALGVLKADVDHLGLLMAYGLKTEHFTLSRLATLSRQLNWFFALYLPHLLKTDDRFGEIYTVFAGGDDLFLIGPWNRIIELAGFLNRQFTAYVCNNEDVHLSAGITLHKANTPLDRMAEDAEMALARAKSRGRNRLTLFSQTATWNEFHELQKIKIALQRWVEDQQLNSAMIYHLNEFITMAEAEKRVLQPDKTVSLEDMECLKWHAHFYYALERNVGRQLKGEARQAFLAEFTQAAAWLKEYGATLKMALWDVIYNRRRGR